MGLFSKQFANVVEWQEFRDDMIFYKWNNQEIKKGSRLIIRPGQDAIFLSDGKIEGIFKDEGSYDIESQIIPFLSTLKGFKFGFHTGMRAEVLFVNTKEFVVKWGTINAINIPAPQLNLPGGLPIRAHGTLTVQVKDYVKLIDGIAGIKNTYCVEDVKLRIISVLDQLLMKWIAAEGKDLFHLQANAAEIGNGIREDLDMQLFSTGISITGFTIMSFTYPDEIQKMINKNASHSMIGDMNRYQQASVIDSMSSGSGKSGSVAGDMAGMMVGINMANQMAQQINQSIPQQGTANQASSDSALEKNTTDKPNFCPACGKKLTEDFAFCPNCGKSLKKI